MRAPCPFSISSASSWTCPGIGVPGEAVRTPSEGVLPYQRCSAVGVGPAITTQATRCSVTVSAGVATYPRQGVGRDELIRLANNALYWAKEHGKNRVRVSRPDVIELAELKRLASGPDRAARYRAAASLAKAYCSDAYFHAAAENIQIHGGIGFTWEHDAHLYFKRAKSSEILLGDATYHRELLAQRIGI